MVGHQDKIELFKKLADGDNLSHSYLFFGEPQVGKFLFADYLANYLEYGKFEAPKKILEEVLFLFPNEKGVIGIDTARNLPHFLYQQPVLSKKRTVVIRDAETLTAEAQNAILKIVEDSPPHALIIFIVASDDLLLPPLVSRLQKVYFSRVAEKDIEKFLKQIYGKKADSKKIKGAAEQSFGRPGRAIDFLEDTDGRAKKITIADAVENNRIDDFFEERLVALRQSGYKDLETAKEMLKRLSLIKMYNTNKKLQLKAIGAK